MKRTFPLWITLSWIVASAQQAQVQPLAPLLTVHSQRSQDLAVEGQGVFVLKNGTLAKFDTATRRTAWRKPLVRQFSAAQGRVFALFSPNRLQAYDGASGRSLWTAATAAQGQVVYAAGSVVIVSAPTKSEAFDQTSGKRLWTRDDSIPQAEQVIAGRYWLWRELVGEPLSRVPSINQIDLTTGQIVGGPGVPDNSFAPGATITNLTRNGKEFVEVSQNPSPGLIDVSPERYEVKINLLDAQAWLTDPSVSTPTQRLGAVMAGPRPGCQADGDPNGGVVSPDFVAANSQDVWLKGYDSCGPYIAQIPRTQPQTISYFKLPLNAAQRQLVHGENPVLAAARTSSDMRWAAQIGPRVYLLHNDARLEVLDAGTGRRIALLHLPPKQTTGLITWPANQSLLVFSRPVTGGFDHTVFRLP